jgi:YVTN family beta-propeller protein
VVLEVHMLAAEPTVQPAADELRRTFALFWLGLVAWALLGGGGGCTTAAPNPHEAAGFQTFTSPQSNPIVLSPDGAFVYVATTTSNSVAFLRTSDFTVTRNVPTGLEPVSLAVRPDGLELWVSNHVSDSVSVIDTNAASASYGQVIETIQMLDASGVTQFDEPVGIAFASNAKAYVALSSRNRIAIVDVASYAVTGFIEIPAQEPRAIAVRNGKLYVAAFESGNHTQLSACENPDPTPDPGDDCTLGQPELLTFATQPNLPLEVKNIVSLPNDIPDRDVFVYSTVDEALLSTASHVGTLLYGLAVAADGAIYVSQTDARNSVNGPHDSLLADLDGRMFDNEIARVTCGTSCTATVTNLEPGNPTVTTHTNSRATPYGLALSGNDETLLVTAAGVNRLVSIDTATMTELDVLDVGAIPKGVAFDAPGSASGTAYVLNTLGNSVSKVSVDADGILGLIATRTVGSDPTPAAIRNGNIAFNSAFASSTGSHSCGSCHPDGNTDQLLWRIGGNCAGIGCGDGDEPRSTMPVRGLKNTLPLHWDGTLGDPFGGGNGSVGLNGAGGTGCTLGDPDGDHDCFLNLVEGSLNGVMCDQSGACPNTGLSTQQQDDMATFLASVSYPPARSRRLDDTLSDDADPADLNGLATSARQGFADFFTDVNGAGQPRTCADADGGCHALPLGASTNSATLNGFDAPTMRGLTDRFLQFSMAPTAAVGVQDMANAGSFLLATSPLEPEIAWDPATGFREVTVFGAAFGVFESVYGVRPPDLFQMFEEASTGYSGAVGRQLTLNTATATLPATEALLADLEAADTRGVVNLRGRTLRAGASVDLSFDAVNVRYVVGTGSVTLTRAALLAEAQAGTTLATLTAHLRSGVTNGRQPLLATTGAIGNGLVGDPPLPRLASLHPPFNVAATDVSSTATVVVDGQPVSAVLTCAAGVTAGFCNNGTVSIDLAARPTPDGLHLVQVQNPSGLLSNELPLCVAPGTSLALCLSD